MREEGLQDHLNPQTGERVRAPVSSFVQEANTTSLPPRFRKSRKTQLSDVSATQGGGRWGTRDGGTGYQASPRALSHLSEH